MTDWYTDTTDHTEPTGWTSEMFNDPTPPIRLNTNGLSFHIESMMGYIGHTSYKFIAICEDYNQIHGFLNSLYNGNDLTTIYIGNRGYTGTITQYSIESNNSSQIYCKFEMFVIEEQANIHDTRIYSSEDKYPHECPECNRKLSFTELWAANIGKKEKFLKDLWENPDIKLLCCSCHRKKQPNTQRIGGGSYETPRHLINDIWGEYEYYTSADGTLCVTTSHAMPNFNNDIDHVSIGFDWGTTVQNPIIRDDHEHEYNEMGVCGICNCEAVHTWGGVPTQHAISDEPLRCNRCGDLMAGNAGHGFCCNCQQLKFSERNGYNDSKIKKLKKRLKRICKKLKNFFKWENSNQ